ncbi:hypothetical protein GQ607_009355 [Colletotrichum asianum]|uniref:Uncharacterized protein n=1 Tax=Colletotrichum asianum TaxID=702518 RepID=A0A8H3W8V2_9PEZI|nr:hypothetical protein GQ607_009355 [Colletotrichum asianum]
MHPPSVTFTLSVSLPFSARDSSLAPGQLAPCLCPPFALCLLSLSSSPSIRLSGPPTPTPTPLPSLSMYGPLSLRLEAPQSFPSPTPTGRHSTPALFGLGPPRAPGKGAWQSQFPISCWLRAAAIAHLPPEAFTLPTTWSYSILSQVPPSPCFPAACSSTHGCRHPCTAKPRGGFREPGYVSEGCGKRKVRKEGGGKIEGNETKKKGTKNNEKK